MEKEKKLGAGIITLSVLILIGVGLGIIGTVVNLVMGDTIKEMVGQSGQFDTSTLPTTTDYIISLVVTILNGIFVILILLKNKIGVFGYFTVSILSSTYNLIVSGITTMILVGLVFNIGFLVLYGFFIYKKRDIFGLSKEAIEVTN